MLKKTHKQYITELTIKKSEYEVLEPYVNSKTSILHRHKICGYEWSIKPNNILSGYGCPECAINAKKTHSKYIKDPRVAEYEVLESYLNALTKILHRHKACGYEWYVRPNNILAGRGCPECAGTSGNKVYLIHFPELGLHKIGITNNPEKRVKEFGYKADIIWVEEYSTHEKARNREKELLSTVTIVNTGLLRSGNTETFIKENIP